MDNKKENNKVSKGWLIFWFLFFPPVGIYLLVAKKSTGLSNGTGPIVVGCLLLFNALITISELITGQIKVDNYTGLVIGTALGVTLVVWGNEKRKRLKRCRNYVDYITLHKIYSIDKMANIEKVTFEKVVEELTFLYNNCYLNDSTYLDVPNRVVVERVLEYETSNITETKTVHCSGCGASNLVIIGRVSECEYCGTTLTA